MSIEAFIMTDEADMIPYSLCDDCPIKDTCGTSKMQGIVTGCGKRAEFEKE